MPEEPHVTDWTVELVPGTDQWGLYRLGDPDLIAGPCESARDILQLLPSYAQSAIFEQLHSELADVSSRLDRVNATLTEIKVALGGVATYDGLLDVSPVAMLVANLVADHERLEQRIENVLTYLGTGSHPLDFDPKRIEAMLRGASPFPDTIEGIDP